MALVLALLAATAIAFGVIEGLKLEPNPISGPQIDDSFSPVCRCPQRVAHISFRLRKTGALTVTVVTPDNRLVRTLVDGRRFRHNRLHFTWNGRTDDGALAPDGRYRIRIHLGGQHRTIVLPRGTRIDTKPPRVRVLAVYPRVISPDGDHRRDTLAVRYRVSEASHAQLLVDGKTRVRGRFAPLHGTLYWSGTAGGGRVLPAGVYHVAVVAEDLAGNLSRPSRSVPVRIRFVTLGRTEIRARAGTRFGVSVRSDARLVHWRYRGRTGTTRPGLLVLEAGRRGRSALVVEANGHRARASVVVTAR
jgi:hypothetical protein